MSKFSGNGHLSPPELLSYWISEREAVRLCKEAGLPKPWSDDPVFQNTYFCNVRREDDKVTRWLRANWLVCDKNYEFAMVLARLINRPSTLEAIGYPDDFAQLGADITAVHATVKPFWGNAYVVTTHGQRVDKLTYLVGLLEGAHKVLPLTGVAATCAAYHKALKGLEGFSDFMAAQIVADLKNTSFHLLAHATDFWTFAAPGPGSLRGMSWFFHGEPNRRISKGATFRDNLEEVRHNLEDQGSEIIHTICNQDLQNCLCEFDKYMRVRTGAGRSKRKYPGTA